MLQTMENFDLALLPGLLILFPVNPDRVGAQLRSASPQAIAPSAPPAQKVNGIGHWAWALPAAALRLEPY
jgi:hypothetical protein